MFQFFSLNFSYSLYSFVISSFSCFLIAEHRNLITYMQMTLLAASKTKSNKKSNFLFTKKINFGVNFNNVYECQEDLALQTLCEFYFFF